MSAVLYVAIGGAIGASGRYLLGEGARHCFGASYPYGTLLANLLGGFLMGILVVWLASKAAEAENMRLLLGVGVLGGFTTFSAFSLDAFLMIERRAYGPLIGYVGGSVVGGILALALGVWIGQKMLAS